MVHLPYSIFIHQGHIQQTADLRNYQLVDIVCVTDSEDRQIACRQYFYSEFFSSTGFKLRCFKGRRPISIFCIPVFKILDFFPFWLRLAKQTVLFRVLIKWLIAWFWCLPWVFVVLLLHGSSILIMLKFFVKPSNALIFLPDNTRSEAKATYEMNQFHLILIPRKIYYTSLTYLRIK